MSKHEQEPQAPLEEGVLEEPISEAEHDLTSVEDTSHKEGILAEVTVGYPSFGTSILNSKKAGMYAVVTTTGTKNSKDSVASTDRIFDIWKDIKVDSDIDDLRQLSALTIRSINENFRGTKNAKQSLALVKAVLDADGQRWAVIGAAGQTRVSLHRASGKQEKIISPTSFISRHKHVGDKKDFDVKVVPLEPGDRMIIRTGSAAALPSEAIDGIARRNTSPVSISQAITKRMKYAKGASMTLDVGPRTYAKLQKSLEDNEKPQYEAEEENIDDDKSPIAKLGQKVIERVMQEASTRGKQFLKSKDIEPTKEGVLQEVKTRSKEFIKEHPKETAMAVGTAAIAATLYALSKSNKQK